jgi:hypothetical protein
VDFSEPRDLFVNIFRISGRTAKIPNRGLISEKPEGLSAKSAKSAPWVDFPNVQGSLCKISEISEITNYFLTDNSWTGSTSPWTGRARARRRAHRSSASSRSGAPKLTGGGAKRRGRHGELN